MEIKEIFQEMHSSISNAVNDAIDVELGTMLSCAAAGFPVDSMCVVHAVIDTSIYSGIDHKVSLMFENRDSVIKSGMLSGYRATVYSM